MAEEAVAVAEAPVETKTVETNAGEDRLTPQQRARQRIEDQAKKPGERDTVLEGLIADYKSKGSSLVKGKAEEQPQPDAQAEAPKEAQTASDMPVGDKIVSPEAVAEADAEAKKSEGESAVQRRIDELVGKIKELERQKEKPKSSEPATLEEMSDDQLKSVIRYSMQNKYFPDDSGEGDVDKNLTVRLEAEAELVRRKAEAKSRPQKEQQEIQESHFRSYREAAEKHVKHLFSKDKEGKLVYDKDLPVSKRANQLFTEWMSDPVMARNKDLPRLAVEVAIGQIASETDIEKVKKIHKLETEIERLKAQGRVDAGRPGGPATQKKEKEEPETTRDILSDRVAEANKRRGIAARPRA